MDSGKSVVEYLFRSRSGKFEAQLRRSHRGSAAESVAGVEEGGLKQVGQRETTSDQGKRVNKATSQRRKRERERWG